MSSLECWVLWILITPVWLYTSKGLEEKKKIGAVIDEGITKISASGEIDKERETNNDTHTETEVHFQCKCSFVFVVGRD